MSHLHHRLSALADGELAGWSRRRALDHLKSCSDCRRELHATLELKRRLTGLRPSEPSADLFSSLDSMSAEQQTVPASSGGRRTSLRRVFAGAGTASLALVSLAYIAGAPEATESAAVAPPVDEANAEFAALAGGYGLSDPAVDALLAESGHQVADGVTTLAPIAYGVGAVAALATVGRGDDAAAVSLLRRAARAPAHLAYHGVRVVRDYSSGASSSARVAVNHVPEQGTSYRAIDSGAGGSQTALFIDRSHDPLGPSLGHDPVGVLTSNYDVDVIGHDSVLGRRATVVGVGASGELVASLWIDDATGVLLDRRLYDDGMLVRSSAFESLTITRHGFMAHPPPEVPAADGLDLSTRSAGAMGDEGWSCPNRLGSGMTLTGLGRLGGSREVVEAVYTDGISSMSLFEQRGALDSSALAGYRQTSVAAQPVYVHDGLPSTWVWQSGGTVYTLLSDAPTDQAADAVADLPHAAGADVGGLHRLGVGFDRIGSFLNPVH